jgi:hypothetical protein
MHPSSYAKRLRSVLLCNVNFTEKQYRGCMKIMKHRLVYINLVTAKIMVTGERGAILLKKEKQLL